ncbi:MAG: YeeE/YedE thiosulfate transporter family protein [Deltaproteobacteria bacterium]|nr:YeeE/YedE thiosulfate transporter family protein [Deltaproteobacteria bacterium]
MPTLSQYLVPLSGGLLIGIGASVLLLMIRQTAGISGVLEGFIRELRAGRLGWRASFLGGLVSGGVLLSFFVPGAIVTSPRALPLLLAGGVLVGFGTRLGGGCTSGHGVCGISRLSLPSTVATATFIASGVATVAVLRFLGVA